MYKTILDCKYETFKQRLILDDTLFCFSLIVTSIVVNHNLKVYTWINVYFINSSNKL